MSVSQVIFTPIVMFIEKIGPHPTSRPVCRPATKSLEHGTPPNQKKL
jgi:hypothetical protein